MKINEILNNALILRESPQLIDAEDWGLSNADKNQQLYTTLTKYHAEEKIGTYKGLDLYRRKGQFFAINPENTEAPISYWIKTEVHRLSAANVSGITQHALWRNTDDIATTGITSYIFFKILLPQYGAIISDGLQTQDGKRFWINRISEAFDKELNIYVLHELAPRKLIKILDQAEFAKLNRDGQIWGKEPKYKNFKLIITDKILTPGNGVELDD